MLRINRNANVRDESNVHLDEEARIAMLEYILGEYNRGVMSKRNATVVYQVAQRVIAFGLDVTGIEAEVKARDAILTWDMHTNINLAVNKYQMCVTNQGYGRCYDMS